MGRRDRLVNWHGIPFLYREHLYRTRQWSVRLHDWTASDHDRALHDHPWDSVTVVLDGELIEHGPTGSQHLTVGDVVTRQAATPHRIELVTPTARTLFTTGPIVRDWGFHTDQGWVAWHEYPYVGRTELVHG